MTNVIQFPTRNATAAKSDSFTVGQTYASRCIGDADLVTEYKVVSRSKSFVTLETEGKIIGKKKVLTSECGAEYCKPEGDYSMCPILRCR